MRHRGRADGNVRTTIGQVAALAAVSTATASRVFNHPDAVRVALRERVDAAVAQLGYIPNRTARALSSLHTGLIGVLVPSLAGRHAVLVEALEKRLSELGYAMLAAAAGSVGDLAVHTARAMAGREIEGLLVVGAAPQEALRALLDERRIPWVMVDAVGGRVGDVAVGADYAAAGRIAAHYLLAFGHRAVAFLGRAGDEPSAELLAGLRVVLADAGDTLPPERIWTDLAPDTRGALRIGLAAAPPPTALFCADDLLALEAIHLCAALGIAVPGRMSIVGCGDAPFARHAVPALSTLRIPGAAIGRAAVDQLRVLLEGRSPVAEAVPVKLIVRQSSGPAPA